MTQHKGWWASQSAEMQMALGMGVLVLVAGVVAVGYEISKRSGSSEVASPNAPAKLNEAKPTVTNEPEIPSKVTHAWCGRLAKRLEPRFLDEAKTKYAGRDPAYVQRVVSEYIRNLAFNCTQDVGKPTEGEWVCHWNSSFDTYKDCEKLAKRL